MRITKKEIHAVSASPWIPLDPNRNPVGVGFYVQRTGGAATDATYSVQHTFDDVLADASATAFDHSTVSGKTSVLIEGSYTYPISAIRLNVTAVSGAASVTLGVIQAGINR